MRSVVPTERPSCRRDRVPGVVPPDARRAAWFRAEVMRSCGRQKGTRDQRAEHAHAADRFAREIIRFLTVAVVRSRRLMGIPLGRAINASAEACWFAFTVQWSQVMGLLEREQLV